MRAAGTVQRKSQLGGQGYGYSPFRSAGPAETAWTVNFMASGMMSGAIVNYDQSVWEPAVAMPVPDGPMMLSPD
jgi:hypothetical protein